MVGEDEDEKEYTGELEGIVGERLVGDPEEGDHDGCSESEDMEEDFMVHGISIAKLSSW